MIQLKSMPLILTFVGIFCSVSYFRKIFSILKISLFILATSLHLQAVSPPKLTIILPKPIGESEQIKINLSCDSEIKSVTPKLIIKNDVSKWSQEIEITWITTGTPRICPPDGQIDLAKLKLEGSTKYQISGEIRYTFQRNGDFVKPSTVDQASTGPEQQGKAESLESHSFTAIPPQYFITESRPNSSYRHLIVINFAYAPTFQKYSNAISNELTYGYTPWEFGPMLLGPYISTGIVQPKLMENQQVLRRSFAGLLSGGVMVRLMSLQKWSIAPFISLGGGYSKWIDVNYLASGIWAATDATWFYMNSEQGIGYFWGQTGLMLSAKESYFFGLSSSSVTIAISGVVCL